MTPATPRRTYHHGDLRAALLEAAADQIAEVGLADLSLRRISARAGVSHTAGAHHFGDKRGLLTALAVQGHERLAAAMASAGDDMMALGQAYVRFATEHPAHFEVMFQPTALREDDPSLADARESTFGALAVASGGGAEGRRAAYAAWAFAHGVSELALTANLPPALGDTPVEAFTTLASRTRFR